MSKSAFDLRYLFLKFRNGVVRICIEQAREPNRGDKGIGTGFHIGEGLIVTARHVATEKIDFIKREPDGMIVTITGCIFDDDENVDLAVLKTDFHNLPPPNPRQKRICLLPLGQYLDEWLGDDFVLSKVLVMGFPRIPMTQETILVSAEAEINAMVTAGPTAQRHFILSSMARGGFSGGPIISAAGFVLGVVTLALTADKSAAETGFFAATSVEPLLRLLAKNNLGKDSCIDGDVWRFLRKRPANSC